MSTSVLTKRDYLLSSFIGLCVAFFLLPTLKNILGEKIGDLNTGTLFLSVIAVGLSLSVIFSVGLFVASLIAKKIPVILQIAKFGLVGIFNTLLDWGVVNLLMLITGIFSGVWFAAFNVISFVIANIASFFWNKHWTFSAESGEAVKNFFQFFIVSVVGLLIKTGTASFIVDVIGPMGDISQELWAQVGLLFATALSMVWNFLGYKFIVFKK